MKRSVLVRGKREIAPTTINEACNVEEEHYRTLSKQREEKTCPSRKVFAKAYLKNVLYLLRRLNGARRRLGRFRESPTKNLKGRGKLGSFEGKVEQWKQ